MRRGFWCPIGACDSSYRKARLVTVPLTAHALGMNDTFNSRPTRYSRGAIILHWPTAALILSTIPLGWFGASYETEAAQSATNAHKTIGIMILALTLVRIGWRLTHTPPALPDAMARSLRWIAKISHTLFYVLLLVMPLSGWWMSSAVPDRHNFGFGFFDIPFLPVPRGW